MTSKEQTQAFNASDAHRTAYRARRHADCTATMVRLAGTGPDRATTDPAFPCVDRKIQVDGHPLSMHWAFGASEEGEQDGLVLMPGGGAADRCRTFRVSVLRHEAEAGSANVGTPSALRFPSAVHAPVEAEAPTRMPPFGKERRHG